MGVKKSVPVSVSGNTLFGLLQNLCIGRRGITHMNAYYSYWISMDTAMSPFPKIKWIFQSLSSAEVKPFQILVYITMSHGAR
ncbi:hypothetical protein B1F73_04325 [Pseudomonas syringae]|nr:hypothetical protein B1F73_04325 [Pseudomonas syringae]RXU21020.1 hypothetical protein B0A92_24150 [Pseudomonas syringae]